MAVRPTMIWKGRLKACAIHLGLCLLTVAPAGLRAFGLWCSSPRRDEAARAGVLQTALPVAKLKARFAAPTGRFDLAAKTVDGRADERVDLSMASRKTYWTVLLAPVTAQPLASLPLDSF